MERPLGVVIISVLSVLGEEIFMLGSAATLTEAIIAGRMFKEMLASQFLVSIMMLLTIGILLLFRKKLKESSRLESL